MNPSNPQQLNQNRNALISRKEIAQLLGVTADQVRKNERRWGLDKSRCDLNCRCVRYRRAKATAILKGRGFIE